MIDILAAVGAMLAGLAGCGWIGNAIFKGIFGGEERRANAIVAVTGAAKVMIDELQEEARDARKESQAAREETRAAREETRAARFETRAARGETEELRQQINELRRLTDAEIARYKNENASLIRQVAELSGRQPP